MHGLRKYKNKKDQVLPEQKTEKSVETVFEAKVFAEQKLLPRKVCQGLLTTRQLNT